MEDKFEMLLAWCEFSGQEEEEEFVKRAYDDYCNGQLDDWQMDKLNEIIATFEPTKPIVVHVYRHDAV